MIRSTFLTSLLISSVLAVPFPQSVHSQSRTQKEAQPFTIDFPQSVNTGRLQIYYVMTGSSGTYGDRVVKKSGEHRILLPRQVEVNPASILKVILYVPGCQIVTIEVPDLAKSTLQASFQCHSLPTIAFTGRVAPAGEITDTQAVVDIRYFPLWAMWFFGIADGSPPTFRIATVPLEAGGVFHAELPDFSKFCLPIASKQSIAYKDLLEGTGFDFIVRNEKTWNILGILAPPNARRVHPMLPIQPEYPSEVLFTVGNP